MCVIFQRAQFLLLPWMILTCMLTPVFVVGIVAGCRMIGKVEIQSRLYCRGKPKGHNCFFQLSIQIILNGSILVFKLFLLLEEGSMSMIMMISPAIHGIRSCAMPSWHIFPRKARCSRLRLRPREQWALRGKMSWSVYNVRSVSIIEGSGHFTIKSKIHEDAFPTLFSGSGIWDTIFNCN